MAQVAQVAQVQRARYSSRYLRKMLESMNLHDMAKHPKIRGPLPKECRHHLYQQKVSIWDPMAYESQKPSTVYAPSLFSYFVTPREGVSRHRCRTQTKQLRGSPTASDNAGGEFASVNVG